MLKNKIECFLKTTILFEKNYFFFYYSKYSLKNEFFLLTNANVNFFKKNYLAVLSDLISYDNKFLINFYFLKNSYFYYKFYYYHNDYYLNILTTEKKFLKKFKNSVWLSREFSENFNFNFIDLPDNRNLILDYNFPRGVLLKSNSLESYLEIRKWHKKLKYQHSSSVEL